MILKSLSKYSISWRYLTFKDSTKVAKNVVMHDLTTKLEHQS